MAVSRGCIQASSHGSEGDVLISLSTCSAGSHPPSVQTSASASKPDGLDRSCSSTPHTASASSSSTSSPPPSTVATDDQPQPQTPRQTLRRVCLALARCLICFVVLAVLALTFGVSDWLFPAHSHDTPSPAANASAHQGVAGGGGGGGDESGSSDPFSFSSESPGEWGLSPAPHDNHSENAITKCTKSTLCRLSVLSLVVICVVLGVCLIVRENKAGSRRASRHFGGKHGARQERGDGASSAETPCVLNQSQPFAVTNYHPYEELWPGPVEWKKLTLQARGRVAAKVVRATTTLLCGPESAQNSQRLNEWVRGEDGIYLRNVEVVKDSLDALICALAPKQAAFSEDFGDPWPRQMRWRRMSNRQKAGIYATCIRGELNQRAQIRRFAKWVRERGYLIGTVEDAHTEAQDTVRNILHNIPIVFSDARDRRYDSGRFDSGRFDSEKYDSGKFCVDSCDGSEAEDTDATLRDAAWDSSNCSPMTPGAPAPPRDPQQQQQQQQRRQQQAYQQHQQHQHQSVHPQDQEASESLPLLANAPPARDPLKDSGTQYTTATATTRTSGHYRPSRASTTLASTHRASTERSRIPELSVTAASVTTSCEDRPDHLTKEDSLAVFSQFLISPQLDPVDDLEPASPIPSESPGDYVVAPPGNNSEDFDGREESTPQPGDETISFTPGASDRLSAEHTAVLRALNDDIAPPGATM
eukprot:Rhum_TRINITY_DN14977_c28_g1::Rhum_TRINITY_DN14977_c28_g1_i1::g.132065::m.132065